MHDEMMSVLNDTECPNKNNGSFPQSMAKDNRVWGIGHDLILLHAQI